MTAYIRPFLSRLPSGVEVYMHPAPGVRVLREQRLDWTKAALGLETMLVVHDPASDGQAGPGQRFSVTPLHEGILGVTLREQRRYDAVVDHEGVYLRVVQASGAFAERLARGTGEFLSPEVARMLVAESLRLQPLLNEAAVDWLADPTHAGHIWNRYSLARHIFNRMSAGGVPGHQRKSKPIYSWPRLEQLGGDIWRACFADVAVSKED